MHFCFYSAWTERPGFKHKPMVRSSEFGYFCSENWIFNSVINFSNPMSVLKSSLRMSSDVFRWNSSDNDWKSFLFIKVLSHRN